MKTTIQSLLKVGTIPAEKPKPFPTSGPNGEPHIAVDLEPGQKVPAGTLNLKHSEVPLKGEKCSVTGCKTPPTYVMTNLGTRDPSVQFEQQDITRGLSADEGLVANINALMQSIRSEPARLVPEKTIRLCLRHHGEYIMAMNEQITADREARTPKSWPLHELNPEGATVELDGDFLVLTEAPEHGGRSVRLEMYRSREVDAWKKSIRYHNRVLSPEDIRKVQKLTRLEAGMTMQQAEDAAAADIEAQTKAILDQAQAINKAQQADRLYNLGGN